MQALAKDCDKVLLPNGISVDLKQISRKGYEVKPSTYKTVNVYVPENLQDDAVI